MKRGRVVISTEDSQEEVVAKVLADLRLSWQIVRNRRQIMILPRNVTKATGLAAALRRFRLSDCDAIAVGDAENDVALFKSCGCGVAVANAVPELKEVARFVTSRGTGAGVVELVNRLLKK